MPELAERLLPDSTARGVYPDGAHEPPERRGLPANAVAGPALQPEEAAHIAELLAEGFLHHGRVLLPDHPEDPLDLAAGACRGSARAPGEQRARIRGVVANEVRRPRLEFAVSAALAVLAQIPFGPVAEVGGLVRQ